MAYSMKELADEAFREVGMRERVYRRWVQEGRQGWTEERAETGIAKMRQIAQHLRKLAVDEEPQGRLI